ncbi:MAG TPA: LysM peptidoglycan-binding domain-containing protein [Motilibacteraceae bacterium]|nr:LysM peptidoglycan-binding domain-containing protein [Motilibacteraceae bacterium]
MSSTTIATPFTRPAVRAGVRVSERISERPARGAARPARRSVRRPVRLTRRGRLLATLTVAAIAVVAFVLAGLGPAGAGTPATAGQTRVVTVAPGQTLWQIAGQIAPGRDPRDVVAQIAALNHLRADQLAAGQELLVPVAR